MAGNLTISARSEIDRAHWKALYGHKRIRDIIESERRQMLVYTLNILKEKYGLDYYVGPELIEPILAQHQKLLNEFNGLMEDLAVRQQQALQEHQEKRN